ncbi:uncharacterized protein LOC126983264 [Eriocheir sinensis]|uniref:uncharacterized protein LOC126983264 n=1 Tax=Eriocheir sinensis TaxID=95602 RepID=UPI0021C8D704|nr:uncharacterized protein LOC126983264 [Eriocheir sinensis]
MCLATDGAAEEDFSGNTDEYNKLQNLSPVKRGVLGGGYGHNHGYRCGAYGHSHGNTHGYPHGNAQGYGHGYAYGHGHGYTHSKVPAKPEPKVPACAANSSRPWCLVDAQYPAQEIQHAAELHFHSLLPLYTDVANLNTELSVDPPVYTLKDETYLCPSSTAYVKPLRVVNAEGRWRIVVNGVKLYKNTLTQTARVETCKAPRASCPKVPDCLKSSCREKSVYHRFLVYDPYDLHLPFGIESFKLPSACACYLGASPIPG